MSENMAEENFHKEESYDWYGAGIDDKQTGEKTIETADGTFVETYYNYKDPEQFVLDAENVVKEGPVTKIVESSAIALYINSLEHDGADDDEILTELMGRFKLEVADALRCLAKAWEGNEDMEARIWDLATTPNLHSKGKVDIDTICEVIKILGWDYNWTPEENKEKIRPFIPEEDFKFVLYAFGKMYLDASGDVNVTPPDGCNKRVFELHGIEIPENPRDEDLIEALRDVSHDIICLGILFDSGKDIKQVLEFVDSFLHTRFTEKTFVDTVLELGHIKENIIIAVIETALESFDSDEFYNYIQEKHYDEFGGGDDPLDPDWSPF